MILHVYEGKKIMTYILQMLLKNPFQDTHQEG